MKKAIVYDFDGTLTQFPLPKFEILEKCGLKGGASNPIFLNRVKETMKEANIDFYVAIYKTYFDVIKENDFELIDSNFCLGNDSVIYNEGVIDFLEMVVNMGASNYLLSSGLKVYLDSLPIAHLFKGIYGTTFVYNKNKAIGVEYLMSDKSKVEVIKNINKNNNKSETDCSDIIYIGDGLTDLYAMEYVMKNGGISIFVFQNENSKDIDEMREKEVVSEFFKADFSECSNLNKFVKKICKTIQY